MEPKARMKALYTAYRTAKASGNRLAADKLFIKFIQVSYSMMPK